MTEQTLESGSNVSDDINANGGNSQTESAQQSSQAVAGSASQFVSVEEFEKFKRQVQSDEDRGVAQARKEVSQMRKDFEEFSKLKDKLGDADLAEEFLAMRNATSKLSTGSAQPEASSSQEAPAVGSADPLTATLDQIFDSSGLDRNDPDVIKLSTEHGDLTPEYIGALTQLAIARNREPEASGSGVVLPPANERVAPPDLTEQYINDVIAAQGQPHVIRRLRKEAREKGVDVDNIGFSVG